MTDLFAQFIEHFHFLRPMFLLLMPLALLAFFLWHKQSQQNNSWQHIIDAPLLQSLSQGNETTIKKNYFAWVIALIIIVTSIALAGPSFEKKPQPVIKNQDALILLLDLSLSMYAEDEKPSRLIKAKRKISDILTARDDGLTALIVYSGDAHTVTPLTDDTKTIDSMLAALEPNIMPKFGSNVLRAFEQAKEVMANTKTDKAKIILLTDEVSPAQLKQINSQLNNKIQLSIITFGTKSGAPIAMPNGFLKDNQGNTVIAKLNFAEIKRTATKATSVVHNRLDDKDFAFVLQQSFSSEQANAETNQRNIDIFIDRGQLFILLLIPLLLLGFRRGSGLLLVLLLINPDAANADILDWFKNNDQQAQQAFEQGQYEQASQQFNNPQWKASSLYKQGDYEGALEAYKSFNDSDSLYNQANSLAKLGKLEEALSKYNDAIAMDASNEDAKNNKQLVEEMLKQEQEQQQNGDSENQEPQDGDQQDGENQDSENQGENQESQQNQDSQQQNGESQDGQQQDQQGEQQNSDQQSEQSQQPSGEDTDPQHNEEAAQSGQEENEEQGDETEQQTTAEQESQDELSDEEKQQLMQQAQQQMTPLEKEQQQALQQWLRKIPDDPSGYLRKKFGHQYQRNRKNNELVDKQSQQVW